MQVAEGGATYTPDDEESARYAYTASVKKGVDPLERVWAEVQKDHPRSRCAFLKSFPAVDPLSDPEQGGRPRAVAQQTDRQAELGRGFGAARGGAVRPPAPREAAAAVQLQP